MARLCTETEHNCSTCLKSRLLDLDCTLREGVRLSRAAHQREKCLASTWRQRRSENVSRDTPMFAVTHRDSLIQHSSKDVGSFEERLRFRLGRFGDLQCAYQLFLVIYINYEIDSGVVNKT